MLKKADVFQGKRKVKDWWSEVEYEVICQVANGMPSYEIKDASSNLKVAHHNRIFLLATPLRSSHAFVRERGCTDSSMPTQPVLVELTPLECENDMLKNPLERCLTHHIASRTFCEDGWMVYCDHCLWWSIDQHKKNQGQG